ncbi:MAG: hypothetical protein JJT75_14760 [Opitutales bacterium]|nr:hypothetical protein [Opitutales bacterium]
MKKSLAFLYFVVFFVLSGCVSNDHKQIDLFKLISAEYGYDTSHEIVIFYLEVVSSKNGDIVVVHLTNPFSSTLVFYAPNELPPLNSNDMHIWQSRLYFNVYVNGVVQKCENWGHSVTYSIPPPTSGPGVLSLEPGESITFTPFHVFELCEIRADKARVSLRPIFGHLLHPENYRILGVSPEVIVKREKGSEYQKISK